jgi:acetoin utilization protein AcuC
VTRGLHVFADPALGRYGFPAGHPLGVDRQAAFLSAFAEQGLERAAPLQASRPASREELLRFHTVDFVDQVLNAERDGREMLDDGDTPVFPGVYEAGAAVVGAALEGLSQVMRGECRATMQPIGGLHHARRDRAAGFCVFSDLGVVVETLRSEYGIRKVAYVDIDVHHGDGVYYPFEDDPDLVFADIHQDWRSIYPGTGRAEETGRGDARGTKLNINLPPGAGDAEFLAAWPDVVRHLRSFHPQFVLFQCGADAMDGDPLGHLRYSVQAYAHAARSLRHLADDLCAGRIMAFGGGGYDRRNLAAAWCTVVRELS